MALDSVMDSAPDQGAARQTVIREPESTCGEGHRVSSARGGDDVDSKTPR